MKKYNWRHKLLVVSMALAMAMCSAISISQFSMVSMAAQSQGKITASSAKIRKEASASSEAIGSASKDDEVTINGKTTAADGTVWYQVFVDAQTLGYIRSDLVTVKDTSNLTVIESSNTQTSTESQTTDAPTVNTTPTEVTPTVTEPTAQVTVANPISATVTGGDQIRVRSDASTSSSIVTNVKKGTALTVTGWCTGNDGNTWYQVEFIDNGSQSKGFMRYDFVELSEELTEYSEAPVAAEEPEEEVPVPEYKDWETRYEDGVWYLIDNQNSCKYKLEETLNAVDYNRIQYENAYSKVKSQKIIIILLIIIVVIAAGAAALFFLKIRDMNDQAMFAEATRENARRRAAAKNRQQTAQRPTAQRPAGARPAQGQPVARPAGARPTQGQPAARPAGARPTQGQPAARPAGARPTQGQPGAGQAGARPTQGVTPSENRNAQPQSRPAERRVERTAQPKNPQQTPSQPTVRTMRSTGDIPAQTSKAKNFMEDDDEFEFEFLNWDGNE